MKLALVVSMALLSGSCPINWPPKPRPSPSPSPTPKPTPKPTPTPSPVGCPAECAEPEWVGLKLLSKVEVDDTGQYLGWRYNIDSTGHTRVEMCQDRPGQATEWRKDCQWPEGPDFYMTLPGKWENEKCDKSSTNNWICHHKPKKDETGMTTFRVVPPGADIDDPRGRAITIDVQK